MTVAGILGLGAPAMGIGTGSAALNFGSIGMLQEVARTIQWDATFSASSKVTFLLHVAAQDTTSAMAGLKSQQRQVVNTRLNGIAGTTALAYSLWSETTPSTQLQYQMTGVLQDMVQLKSAMKAQGWLNPHWNRVLTEAIAEGQTLVKGTTSAGGNAAGGATVGPASLNTWTQMPVTQNSGANAQGSGTQGSGTQGTEHSSLSATTSPQKAGDNNRDSWLNTLTQAPLMNGRASFHGRWTLPIRTSIKGRAGGHAGNPQSGDVNGETSWSSQLGL